MMNQILGSSKSSFQYPIISEDSLVMSNIAGQIYHADSAECKIAGTVQACDSNSSSPFSAMPASFDLDNIFKNLLSPVDLALKSTSAIFGRGGAAFGNSFSFNKGQDCPLPADGAKYFVNSNGYKVLQAGYEIMDAGGGNNDGFCDSNEVCGYAHHWGGMPGFNVDTASQSLCIFKNADVVGVRMFATGAAP